MDTLQNNGITYTKACVLAKRHRYTTDYIGQLCRAHKVDAQLVGRAWYVNENSLLNHKIVKNKDTRQDEILSKNIVQIDVQSDEAEKVAIRPTLSKKTHRQFFSDELHPVLNKHWEYRAVAYADDVATLVPQVTNKIVTTLVESKPTEKVIDLPITLVNPEKVVVKDTSHHNHREHLQFTDLPQVSLSGRLAISDLDAAVFDSESTPVTIDDLPQPEVSHVTKLVKISSSIKPVRVREANVPPRIVPILPTVAVRAVVSAPRVKVVLKTPLMPIANVSLPVPFAKIAIPTPIPRKRSLAVPLVVLFAVLLTGLSLAFSSTLVFENSATRQSFSFDQSFFGEALVYLSL